MPTIPAIFRRARAEGVFTHAYAACGYLGEKDLRYAHADLPDGRYVFDLASLTKALVTTVLIYKALSSGQLTLDAPLQRWLGAKAAFLAPPLRALTVRTLLRHESGLPAWRNLWVGHLTPGARSHIRSWPSLQQTRLLGRLNDISRACHPRNGAASVYSDIGFLLLGLCLELSLEVDLAAQFAALCQDDLRLGVEVPLAYGAAADVSALAVPTAYCALRGRLLIGEVHDENCASLGGIAGHAGLFGSGPAIGQFLSALAATDFGRRLIDDNAAAVVVPAQSAPLNEALVGWRQGADPASAPFGMGGAVGHLGFTGTAFWVCPRSRAYAILLTNRVIGGRTKPGIATVRQAVFAALARI